MNFARTNLNDLCRLLKLTAAVGEDRVRVLSWDQVSGQTSSAYLSASQLRTVQENITRLAPLLNLPAHLSLLPGVILSLCSFNDLGCTVYPQGVIEGNTVNVDLVGFTDGHTAYVVSQVPHSMFGVVAPISVAPAPRGAPNRLRSASISAGAESNNAIRVTGQVKDASDAAVSGVKGIVVRTCASTGGSPTMAVVTGASVRNNGSELWMETDVDGKFVVDVADAAVESVLLEVALDNGAASLLKLSFT